MYAVGDIQRLHIEVSSLCNARCPSCVRNIHGANANTGYTERNLSLADVKKIFSDQPFLTQLKDILFCGNFGDLLMNPETPDIVAWFRDRSPGVRITAGTMRWWHQRVLVQPRFAKHRSNFCIRWTRRYPFAVQTKYFV